MSLNLAASRGFVRPVAVPPEPTREDVWVGSTSDRRNSAASYASGDDRGGPAIRRAEIAMPPPASPELLDDTVFWSARTAHVALSTRRGGAVLFDPEVSPFAGLAPGADDADWADLAALAGPGADVLLAGDPFHPPRGWRVVHRVPGVQLVAETLASAPEPEAVPLAAPDVPEILDLIERTEPGPFQQRTLQMGHYLGIRIDGQLVAMAGERMRPPGWTEISAVCTDPQYRGRGLAARLVRAIAHGIEQRGEIPMLHTGAQNHTAIALYERLGFRLRRTLQFQLLRTPNAGVSGTIDRSGAAAADG